MNKMALYGPLAKYFDTIAAYTTDIDKEVDFLVKIFKKYKVKSVLDIGCGTGRHAIALAKNGFKVIGIDNASKLLQIARSKVGKLKNVSFIESDATKIKEDFEFDAVICMWSTFGELPYKKMLPKIHRIIDRNGIFIVDLRIFERIPNTKTKIVKYERELSKGKIIVSTFDDIFVHGKRIRKVDHFLFGKHYFDYYVNEIFTLSKFRKLMENSGFKLEKIYYDFKNKELNSGHFQFIFKTY